MSYCQGCVDQKNLYLDTKVALDAANARATEMERERDSARESTRIAVKIKLEVQDERDRLLADKQSLRAFAHSVAGLPACLEYAYAHGLLDADGKPTALLTGAA